MSLSREEIIRISCAAYLTDPVVPFRAMTDDALVAFFNTAYAAGAAAEREACAKIGEDFDKERPQSNYGRCLAVAIRARGNGGVM